MINMPIEGCECLWCRDQREKADIFISDDGSKCEKELKCECGIEAAVGLKEPGPGHSTWCPKWKKS